MWAGGGHSHPIGSVVTAVAAVITAVGQWPKPFKKLRNATKIRSAVELQYRTTQSRSGYVCTRSDQQGQQSTVAEALTCSRS